MSKKRVILKFGSGILTRTDRAEMDQVQLARLVEAIAELKHRGHSVVIVSSGAVSSGLKPLGYKERPEDISVLQACAAVGQTHLMHGYESFLRGYGLHVAQLLLTHEDLEDKNRADRFKATLLKLLEFENTVPVINENDSVAVDELKFGDNDKLSARVALLWGAELLVLLTSVPGLMEHRPDGAVDIVPLVEDVESVMHLAQDEKGKHSVGGMSSKLRAVRDAVRGGIECVIASGRHPEQISDLVEGRGSGTRFPAPRAVER
ncbi:MAG TPA: glutamate 5-kinase [Verrucomicrobiaceae bacterium]|jgi:glutamate 5-kinase